MAAERRIVVGDLANLRWAMEPAVHPSAPVLAFVESGPDRATDGLGYRLFVVTGSETRLLEEDARHPRWSPDGSRLAFLRRSGTRWIPACRTIEGEEIAVAPPPGDTSDLEWAPDGRRMLGVTVEVAEMAEVDVPYRVDSSRDWLPRARRRVWTLATGADPLLLDVIAGDVICARWSPDGERIAYVSDDGVDRDTSTATGLWVHEVGAAGASTCVVPPATPIRALAWSPDGSAIAFLANARDNSASALSELWVVDVATLVRRKLAVGLDRSVGAPVRGDDERAIGHPILVWEPDSSSILAVYAEGGRSRLARFDTDGGWEDVIAGERSVLEFSADSPGLAFSWSDPLTPGEISWLDPGTGDIRQLTDVGGVFGSQIQLAPTTRVSVTASDGVEIEGWLTTPPDVTDAPLVLQVHGGPHYAVGERFSFDAQRLAAQGMAVLRANPRGSHGYGQAFADGNLGDWGGRDLDDLLDLVNNAVAQAGLDEHRVGIIGESYGGYLAAWAVATSDRFAVAIVENGIADFVSSAGGAIGPTFWHSEFGGAPWDNPALYMDRSVLTRIDQIVAPVLIIHCEADATCPVAQGEALHAALRELGRPVEFLRVPHEGHFFNVFGALSRRLERTAALDEFLVRHLFTTIDREGMAP